MNIFRGLFIYKIFNFEHQKPTTKNTLNTEKSRLTAYHIHILYLIIL